MEPLLWDLVMLWHSEKKLYRSDSPKHPLQDETIFVGYQVI